MAVIFLKLIRRGLKGLSLAARSLDEWIVSLSSSSGAQQSAKLYRDPAACSLLLKLIEEYARQGRDFGFQPVLAFLPMKDDLVYIRKRGHYYRSFLKKAEEHVKVVDLTEHFLKEKDFDSYFARWHYNSAGNHLVAQVLSLILPIEEQQMVAN